MERLVDEVTPQVGVTPDLSRFALARNARLDDGLGTASRRQMYFISRLDAPEPAWRVDISRGQQRWEKVFLDQDYGGQAQALASAQAWRDAVRDEIRRARGMATAAEQMPSTNTSGVLGVNRTVGRYQTSGGAKEIFYWVAQWTDLEGKKHGRRFSIKRYGEAEARALALRARQEAVKELARQTAERLAMVSAIAPVQTTPVVATPAMRYVQRDEATGALGWHVCIKRQNQDWYKYFSDSTYGGHANALTAAQAWRDETLAQVSGPDYEVWKRARPNASNTSGMVGVARGVSRQTLKNGRVQESAYWYAYWQGLDGKRRTRAISVRKYGEEQAKAIACRIRQEGLLAVWNEAAQVGRPSNRASVKPMSVPVA